MQREREKEAVHPPPGDIKGQVWIFMLRNLSVFTGWVSEEWR